MPPTPTLAIETSNPSAGGAIGVALGQGDRVAGVEMLTEGLPHDEALMPAIDRLCRAAGVSPNDLGLVAVSAGPGGYTAVRIAVTTAKALALALGVPAVGVPSALVAAHEFLASSPDGPPGSTGPFAVALANKDASTYVQIFDARAVPLTTGEDVDATRLSELLAAHHVRVLLADGTLHESLTQAAARFGVDRRPLTLSPASCLRASATLTPAGPETLEVMYPREPEAVVKWRRLHNLPG